MYHKLSSKPLSTRDSQAMAQEMGKKGNQKLSRQNLQPNKVQTIVDEHLRKSNCNHSLEQIIKPFKNN